MPAMRIGCFLLISLALHFIVLNYPVFFPALLSEQLVPVIVLAPEGEENGAPKRTEDNRSQRRQNHPKTHKVMQPRIQTDKAVKADGQEERTVESALIVTSASTEGIVLAADQIDGETEQDTVSLGYAGPGGAVRGDSDGVKGDGGNRVGVESGKGGGGGAIGLVGPSYAYTPKPIYPDIARREGREGTVIVSVLVGEDGRSKSFELKRSSGSEALDKAATDSLRRWRFHAARDGNKSIETWVNVPIVFRLAD
jgi:TonB family protein